MNKIYDEVNEADMWIRHAAWFKSWEFFSTVGDETVDKVFVYDYFFSLKLHVFLLFYMSVKMW